MPQPKRRKLSLDEQDAKESDRNRFGAESDEGIAKSACSDGGRETAGSLSDKRTAKNERKAETTIQSSSSIVATVDDGKDGHPSSATGDSCGRVSSSGRVIKQTNKGRCFTAALEAAQNKQSTSAGQGTGSSVHSTPKPHVVKASTPVRRKRTRKRSWDVWSKFEQDAFFEGLFEHGKDFDAIHNLLVFRSKKRGIETALIKTKDQVRHLYYRMWQKISKHVHMGDNVKKEAQEIYGLVNYYAIRKVFKRIDERAVEHLNELIHSGVSKVRDPNIAGKKNRKKLRVLRTPVCNALKKLNNIEDAKEECVSDMPQQVTVELTPRSSAAWLRVHNLSHNPRVRFQVSVNRSLAGLMEYLNKKWKGLNDRLRNSLGGSSEESDEIVVFPHHSYTLKPVVLAPQRATSVDLITFTSYKDNVLSSPPAGGRSAKKSSEDGKQTNETSPDGDGHMIGDSAKSVKSTAKINLLPRLSDPVVQVPQPPCEDENAMFPDAPLFSPPSRHDDDCKPDSAVDCAYNDVSWPVTSNCDSGEQKAPDISPDASPQGKEKLKDCREEERETYMRHLMESASKGFTCDTGKLVTLAQLSLMLGKAAHIRLEYEWRPKWTSGGGPMTHGYGALGDVEQLTNMLRRLSSLANLEYKDILQRGRVVIGGKMSQCTLCGSSLEKAASRKKATSDVSTETDMLTTEGMSGMSAVQPARLNSNGTLVGMSSKSNFINTLQTPDTDGVFRVPMPIAVPLSIRTGGPHRMSTQPTVGQLIRPPEYRPPKSNFLVPRKKRPQKRSVIGQRTLLPKIPSTSVLLVPQNILMPVQSSVTTVQTMQSSISQGVQQSLQPAAQQSEIAMGTDVLSVGSTASAVQEINAATPAVSDTSLLGESSVSSSDLFACNLDMPVIVSPASSPVKSTSQLISSSISPPSLSSMLDMSLTGPSNQAVDAGDKFLDTLVDGNSGFSGLLKSPLKVEVSATESGSHTTLSPSQQDMMNPAQHNLNTPQHVMNTSPHSLGSPPQRSPLRSGAETQWLGGEVPELSLSGFDDSPAKKSGLTENSNSIDLQAQSLSLSQFLESPVKKSESQECSSMTMPTLSVPSTSSGAVSSTSFIPAPPSLFGESSQDSLVARLDVDSALQYVMTESSIDYSSKFEKLAEHLADNNDTSNPNM